MLARVAGGYRFQTAPAQDAYVERFVREGHSARLSAAALETLAVVAYKQPVSRHQVAEIRGVNVDGVMRTLRRRGYIDEIARAPGPGQAVLYGTTPQFLEHLGLDSLQDLPPLSDFVPDPAEVEAMESRLRLVPDPSGPDPGGPGRRPPVNPMPGGRDTPVSAGEGERLQKVLARCGIGSRRACESLISDGRVRVDGSVARLGDRIDPARCVVEVDGTVVGVRPDLVHYLLNKPRGVVTTAHDPQGRPTVTGLVPAEPRVFPVGRLDLLTEGLLLLTNDGDLAHRLTHPSFGIEKEYLAHVSGSPRPAAVRALRQGVELDDGPTAPARVALVEPDVLRITVREGRNRLVRRMCEEVGHPVRRLVRTRIGPLADRRLQPGSWRSLTLAEARSLEKAANPATGPSEAGRSHR